jgi:ppGpp synthetase/RelA/SpoT-type nucleotidyltranferase
LSKALKLQQENEDRKNEVIINNLEERVKKLEFLKKKIQRLGLPKKTWPKLTFGLRIKLLEFLIKTSKLKKRIQF